MNKPTKEQFHAYLEVQYSGLTNMYDGTTVQRLAYDNTDGNVVLEREDLSYIMGHYQELKEEYGDIK